MRAGTDRPEPRGALAADDGRPQAAGDNAAGQCARQTMRRGGSLTMAGAATMGEASFRN